MRCLLPRSLNNEHGMVMIVAIMLMLSATLIATASILSSNTEIRISANNKDAKLVFYTAEGACQLGINWLDGVTAPPAEPHDDTGTLGNTRYCFRVEPDPRWNGALPGFSEEYQNVQFVVRACGKMANGFQKMVEMRVSKPFRFGY